MHPGARFVPAAGATMGFTRFAPTCIIDVDGPYSTRTRSYYARIWQALERQRPRVRAALGGR